MTKRLWYIVGIGLFILILMVAIFGKRIYFFIMSTILSPQQKAKILQLNPAVQGKFTQLIARIQQMGYKVIITGAHYTYEDSVRLNREDKRNPIINPHLFGIALDLNIEKDGKRWRKATSKAEWLETGVPQLAKSMGFRWGGDFSTYHDPIHFDLYTKYPKDLLVSMWEKTGRDPAKVNKLPIT